MTYDINNHGREDGARDRRTIAWIFCRADHGMVVTLFDAKKRVHVSERLICVFLPRYQGMMFGFGGEATTYFEEAADDGEDDDGEDGDDDAVGL